MNYNLNDAAKGGLRRYAKAFCDDAINNQLPFIMKHGNLGSNDLLLDYGCGLGRISYAIVATNTDIRYLGIDVFSDVIDYLNAHYEDKDNISFNFLPIKSDHYVKEWANKNEDDQRILQSDARLEIDDNSVACEFSMSVFTHMTEDEIVAALREIGRVVRPGGVLINSWLAVDDETHMSLDKGQADRTLPYERNGMLYSHQENIRMATAYRTDVISRIHAAAGLGPYRLYKGSWDGTGRSGSPVYQDICITHVT